MITIYYLDKNRKETTVSTFRILEKQKASQLALHVPVVKYASVETLYSYIIYPLHVVKSDIEFDSAISSFVYAKGTIVTVLISEFEINMVVAISVIFAGRYTVYLIDLYHI